MPIDELRPGSGARAARPWFMALGLGLGVAVTGCGGGGGGPAVGVSAPSRTPAGARAPAAAEEPGLLPARAIAVLDDDRALASFARRGDGRGLLVFVQGDALRGRALDARGAPLGEASTLAPIPAGATHLALRQAGDGFLVAWGAPSGAGTRISLVAVDADARPRGAEVPIAQLADRVAFVDVVASSAAAFVVHELVGRGARGTSSKVTVTPVDPARGTIAGPAAVVADDAIGWNVVATPHGAAAARVLAPPSAAPGGPALGPVLGRVEVVTVDPRGALAPPIVVRAEPTANLDVELASLGDGLLVAWTDATETGGAVTVASVDRAGKASVPRRLTPPGSDDALVGTWAAAGGVARRALIAWESIDPARPPEAPRRFTLASVDGAGTASPSRGSLEFVGPGRPDVVADDDGFAAMVLAHAGAPGAPPAPDAAVWPTFVRVDADLAPIAREPVRAEPFAATDGVPDLAFGLACAAGSCLAIGGAAGAPAPLAAIELAVSADAATSPPAAADATTAPPAPPARAAGSAVPAGPELATALWSGDRLADVAATTLEGGASMVAWVGWHEPGVTTTSPPPRGEKPYAATLAVRPVTGGADVAPTIVSQRADSAGGVSLAPVQGAAGEAVLGWVASEDGIAQVYATRLDASGKKLAQKKVTVVDRGTKARPRSTCSAVDVGFGAQASDGRPGVVIAWIDTRDGDAEVYAARLDARMQKVGADRRITTAPGAATEVKVLVRGAETWVAFVEARDGAAGGDVHLAVLHTGNLEPVAPPVRVFDSPGRAHGVRFVEGDGGRVLLSWIDDAPTTVAGGEAGLRHVEIAGGKPVGSPKRVSALGGAVLDAALGCAAGDCGALGVAAGAPPRLLRVDVSPKAPSGPPRDVGSAHATRVVIAPIAGDGGFIVADDDGRAGRIRLLPKGR